MLYETTSTSCSSFQQGFITSLSDPLDADEQVLTESPKFMLYRRFEIISSKKSLPAKLNPLYGLFGSDINRQKI